ncbi:MAG: hypothetical protein M0D57_04700 [Sphingobacteriales bacterium JAD_PAG50586_3]|nr:MAG: hypothetical protein M0D57_04700 [Sphingobacteriales bacterium JAD_PAG50586_3]
MKERAKHINYGRYTYFDDELELSKKISDLHKELDGVEPQYVFCGSGSTSLLYGIAAYLNRKGTKKVYFIPPMYFTLHIAFDGFGIQTIPISDKHPFERDFKLELPIEEGSVLILIDPIWYAGAPISPDIINEISLWQKKTKSTVIVDGSLQYMAWDHSTMEPTAQLDPYLTFRLICPSKQLSSHGYRFSYVLLPILEKQSFAWTYTNMFGSANADSVAFGHEAIEEIRKRTIPNKIMDLASYRHSLLRSKSAIESVYNPSCGYFIFEKINVKLPQDYIKVDGKYFDQDNFPGYTKINLLSPSINILGI